MVIETNNGGRYAVHKDESLSEIRTRLLQIEISKAVY
jgi:hypothetical protein